MKIHKIIPFLFLIGAISFGSCDIDQTKKGELPDVDVDVEEGQLPAYDIDWAEVNVGTRTETVTIPKVKVVMEEEQVEVPYMDFNMPDAGDKEERTLAVEAEIAGENHDLEITEVYAVNNKLYVLAELESTGESLQDERIRVSDRVIVNAPDMDVKYYIIGARPDGQFNRQYTYINNKSAISDRLKNGKVIYSK